MIDSLITKLRRNYTVTSCKAGRLSTVRRRGMRICLNAYDIAGAGHLCTVEIRGILGLMRLESVILTPFGKDMPVFSAESKHSMGKDSLTVELGDTLLAPLPDGIREALRGVRSHYEDLPVPERQPRPFDDYILEESLAVKGPEVGLKKEVIARKYFECYMAQLTEAPTADPEAKKAKTREFAERLLDAGGPAVKALRRLLGAEETESLYFEEIFGCGW